MNQHRFSKMEDRQRDFKRQQDRLKMMAPDTERKMVSADDMINNLLQKSATFKKVAEDLPTWLNANSALCCPFYVTVWNIVRCSDKMVDTQAISQLLLTSGLHPDTLCFIWNLANKTVPGQLTKQELFCVLALVSLAQSHCGFSSLDVLKQLPTAPIPRLSVLPVSSVVPNTTPTHFSQSNQPTSLPVSTAFVGPQTSATLPALSVPSTATYELATNSLAAHPIGYSPNDHKQKELIDDEFQDFQSSVIPNRLNSSTETRVQNIPFEQQGSFNSNTKFSSSLEATSLPGQTAPVQPSKSATDSVIDSLTNDLLASSFIEKTFAKVTNFPRAAQNKATETKTDERLGADALAITEEVADVPSGSTDDFSDFQDFQSAQLETEIIQPSKVALAMWPSFYKVSPESERKLRNLSQPESLSAIPESKISSRNQVSSMPSISVLGAQPSSHYTASRDVGSRLANHSLGFKTEKNRHPHKHYKVKPIVSGSSPEDIFPRILPKPPTPFLLKETKIPIADIEDSHMPELTRNIEIPIVGTFKETTLPVDMKVPVFEKTSQVSESVATISFDDSTCDLNNFVDKYSALRTLEVYDTAQPEISEDFGEFLSAELTTEKAVEAWTTWNCSVNLTEENDSNIPGGNKQVATLSDVPEPRGTKIFEPLESIDLLGDSFDACLPVALSDSNLALTPPLNLNACLDESSIEEFGDFVAHDDSHADPCLILKPTGDGASVNRNDCLENRELVPEDSSFPDNHMSHLSLRLPNHQPSAKDALSMTRQCRQSPEEVASKCLQCCHGLLLEAVQIFEGVSDKSILKEVLATKEAKNYVTYLQIVYRISQRITLAESRIVTLVADIKQLWEKLDSITSEFCITIPELYEAEGMGSPCAVCNWPTCDQDIHQNGLHYHMACANLWVNCIDTSLPCF